MKTETVKLSWEDVVFESRNKEYGAYSIRKSYDENISKASLISILIAAFSFGIIQVASLWHPDIKINPPARLVDRLINQPIVLHDQPIKKSISNTEQKVSKDLTPTIVKHDVIETPQLKPAETSPLAGEAGINTDLQIDGQPIAGQITNATPIVIDQPRIFDSAEIMPQYDGGLRAMSRFISKNIHYPASARITGLEGTVFVRFVVNNLGQVVDVEVIRGVSALLDKEAMRVVAAMNKWKPGLQHNLPVNVRMVLPIKFQLEK